MWCLGTPGTFWWHCSQSCMYSDETTWDLWSETLLENPWKCHFRDSNFQNVPRCMALKNLCLWCEFQIRLLFIISLLRKTFWQPCNKSHNFIKLIWILVMSHFPSLWHLLWLVWPPPWMYFIFIAQVPLSIKAPLTKLEKNYGQFVWLLLLFFNLIFTF